jgi:hypothetical protein
MKKILFTLPILVFYLVFSQQSHAANKKQIIEDTLHTFLATNTLKQTHQDFWAEELVYTSSSGARFDKAEIMSGFAQEPDAKNDDKTKWSAKDVDVRVYGDIAIVAFKLFNHSSDGQLNQRYFNTGTLISRDGRWQAVAWQATKIPQKT